jgi:hypothetical protein
MKICVFLLGAALAWSAEPVHIPMTAEHWQLGEGAEFREHLGVAALALTKGNAIANGVTFRNGTIEFDVDSEKMGSGIGFRRRDNATYEDFYLRGLPNCSTEKACVQYTPYTHGVELWDLFPQYQAPAPVRESGWNHIRLVVFGRRMNVFVNGTNAPSLQVDRLEGDALEGGLLLHAPGFFANLTITPDAIEGLASQPAKEALAEDCCLVRKWQITPYAALPAGLEPSLANEPAPSAEWRALATERGGLVNVSREHGKPPSRSVVWLKTTIHSQKAQAKQTSIGWLGEVWVFINGQRVYADTNRYGPPTARKVPDGRCSLENGSFSMPLRAGNNEITVALATDKLDDNNFYGWGLKLRLNNAKDVQVAE